MDGYSSYSAVVSLTFYLWGHLHDGLSLCSSVDHLGISVQINHTTTETHPFDCMHSDPTVYPICSVFLF